MFTGIIESMGIVQQITEEGTNRHFEIESPVSGELRVDQSVAHNGVCLTVTHTGGNRHRVTAVRETLGKSTLGSWQAGELINLERCMAANGRFDGHMVQGHVDQVGRCVRIEDQQGSWLFHFEYDAGYGNITVEKGSVAVNGVSLTCFNSTAGGFSVAIIPYTYENTNFNRLHPGDRVNLEFDIIGKYVQRLLKPAYS
jgi:riboflavin synthase